ncbi:hypothetical protein ACH492_36865 [Streptomyces sp. NPDC019443]|uniref:hypothetical protein n=1 Tax=Streptomyces sp. NPDC019443 TaxID=3365061 RepID=UPI0037BC0B42
MENHTDYSQGTQMERLSTRTGEMVPVDGDLGRPLRSPLRELHDTGEPGVVHLEHLNSVAAYDLRSRRLLWERSHPQTIPLAVSGDVLLCNSGDLGEVTALDWL